MTKPTYPCDHRDCVQTYSHAHHYEPEDCPDCAAGRHNAPKPVALWACSCGAEEIVSRRPGVLGPLCPNAYGSKHQSSSQARLQFVRWVS